jgi:hypothetical protein
MPKIDLKCHTRFDFIQSIGPAFPLVVFGSLAIVFSFHSKLMATIMFLSFLWIFWIVFAIPVYLFVSYYNEREVIITDNEIKIILAHGLVSGYTLPLASVRWELQNGQMVIYPFSLFAFIRSHGRRPYRLRLILTDEQRQQWLNVLRS